MIQNPKEKKIPLLFVHIPKAAGSTIKHYFKCFDKSAIAHRTRHYSLRNIKVKIYDKHVLHQCIAFEDYFKFAIFRNPWDKMLSTYNYFIEYAVKAGNEYWIKIKEKKYNFKDWVLHLHEEVGIENTIKKYNYFNYIKLNGRVGVDYIINFYNLNEDFELIKKISNKTECLSIIKKASNGKNIHSKKHEFFKTYYDDKTIELVEKIHAKDIELFNFSFENYEYADLEKFYNLEKIKNILQEIESIK
jgi:chondroitin 4-sulfotransferase 11